MTENYFDDSKYSCEDEQLIRRDHNKGVGQPYRHHWSYPINHSEQISSGSLQFCCKINLNFNPLYHLLEFLPAFFSSVLSYFRSSSDTSHLLSVSVDPTWL